jgi:hypothetical protein
VGGQ